jgi:BlaI family penicillinase repressor
MYRPTLYRPGRFFMSKYKLTETEEKFAEIIWQNEPIGSGELVKLSEKEMNWKKSTTYTVLKKLCKKGLFKNENALVSSIISKEEYYSEQSIRFVEDTFGGSLPKFLTAFISGKKLSKSQAEELKRLIDEHKEV